jgi:hypothetical protein
MAPDERSAAFGSLDLRWPSASDMLRGPGADLSSAVNLEWTRGQEAVRAIAFKEAAGVLADSIAGRG